MLLDAVDTAELKSSLQAFWGESLEIWLAGGWAMAAIAVIALVMFSIAISGFLRLRRKGFQSVSERRWRHWLEHPVERKGPIGRMLDFISGARSLKDIHVAFEHVHAAEAVRGPHWRASHAGCPVEASVSRSKAAADGGEVGGRVALARVEARGQRGVDRARATHAQRKHRGRRA